ncbi:hypothetical protein G5714_003415 [Onychostoma macrolepis]|uniref:Uncharacterized protein n=1 Tax=Onychostoma macrolepis TaxID=369639 RepID=A0A7J6D9E6_9TELE|nr:hypothetical protein G5714_003415 [Onychostoma macrolepis]
MRASTAATGRADNSAMVSLTKTGQTISSGMASNLSGLWRELIVWCRLGSEPTEVLPKMPESAITSPEDSEASLSLTRRRRLRKRKAAKSALVASSTVVLEDLMWVVPEIATETALVVEQLESTPESSTVLSPQSPLQLHSRACLDPGEIRLQSRSTQSPLKSSLEAGGSQRPLQSLFQSGSPLNLFQSTSLHQTMSSLQSPLQFEAIPELIVCPVLVKETMAELSAHPAVEAVIKFFVFLCSHGGVVKRSIGHVSPAEVVIGLTFAASCSAGPALAHCSVGPTPAMSQPIISFGAAGDDDDLDEAMSLMASEKDWAHTPEECSEVEGHATFKDELVQILTRALNNLGLEWESPDEPAKSTLDSWFLHSGRRAAASKETSPVPPRPARRGR